MQIRVVTPEKEICNEKAKSISVPTEAGRVTILPKHIEMISVLSYGNIIIEFEDSKKKKFFIEEGVMEVFKDNVNILLRKCKL